MREELEPGTRVRLSALGKMRCPKMTRDAGVVVAKVPHSDALRVLMDGNKDPSTLHRSYVEAERANVESTPTRGCPEPFRSPMD
jgi:hypothetical protein